LYYIFSPSVLLPFSSSLNLFSWRCGIPGKAGTDWEGGVYQLRIDFSNDFPTKPPKCVFDPVLFHPNIYPSGTVCLSILNEEKDWRASITVKDLLLGIQELLDEPNELDPAQAEPFRLFMHDKAEYRRRVKQQAASFPPA
jgi:ubiquitin-conjugating enzyme E2 I